MSEMPFLNELETISEQVKPWRQSVMNGSLVNLHRNSQTITPAVLGSTCECVQAQQRHRFLREFRIDCKQEHCKSEK